MESTTGDMNTALLLARGAQRVQNHSFCTFRIQVDSSPEPFQQHQEFGQEYSPDLSGRQHSADEECVGKPLRFLCWEFLAFPQLNLYFLLEDTKKSCLPLQKSLCRSLYNLDFKSDNQTLACSTVSAWLAIPVDMAILSAHASLSITRTSLHMFSDQGVAGEATS